MQNSKVVGENRAEKSRPIAKNGETGALKKCFILLGYQRNNHTNLHWADIPHQGKKRKKNSQVSEQNLKTLTPHELTI